MGYGPGDSACRIVGANICDQVTMEMVNVLYDFGRFQYSCGSYVNAAEPLYQFRVLVPHGPFLDRRLMRF